jgi:hypothetical protein
LDVSRGFLDRVGSKAGDNVRGEIQQSLINLVLLNVRCQRIFRLFFCLSASLANTNKGFGGFSKCAEYDKPGFSKSLLPVFASNYYSLGERCNTEGEEAILLCGDISASFNHPSLRFPPDNHLSCWYAVFLCGVTENKNFSSVTTFSAYLR